jgi:5-aminopentanamidase
MRDLRLALAAATPYPGDLTRTLAATANWIEQAQNAKADVLVLPEGYLTGYDLDRVAELALTRDDPAIAHLQSLATQADLTLSIGLLERHTDGFSVSQAWLGKDLCEWYRKCHRTGWEQQHCVAGDMLSVQHLPHITTGTLICYDSAFPAACETLVRRGAELLVTPTCNGTTIAQRDAIGVETLLRQRRQHVHRYWRARAYDTSSFTAYVDNVGETANGNWYLGYAVVFGPDGEVLAEGHGGCEELVVADLSQEALVQARTQRIGHFQTLDDARPELYDLGPAAK